MCISIQKKPPNLQICPSLKSEHFKIFWYVYTCLYVCMFVCMHVCMLNKSSKMAHFVFLSVIKKVISLRMRVVCVYVCMCVCVFDPPKVRAFQGIMVRVSMFVCVYVCVYVYVLSLKSEHFKAFWYVYPCMFARMYVCMCMCSA
jgi:hypothetical protein